MKRTLIALSLLIMTAGFFMPLAGCTMADVQAIKDTISQANQQSDAYTKIIQDANTQLVQAQIQASALPPGLDRDKALAQVVKLQNVVDSASLHLQKIQAVIASLDQQMKDVTDMPGLITAFSATAGTAAPQPYGLLIALAGTTIAGFLRAAQNRAAARNIAESINPLLTPEQKEALKKSASQSATAKLIVDESQGKTVKRPV